MNFLLLATLFSIMKKINTNILTVAVAVLFTFQTAVGQNEVITHKKEVLSWRSQKDQDYKDPEKTMLTKELLKDFEGLNYFDVEYSYRVKAKLERKYSLTPIKIQVSTGGEYNYVVFATATFRLNGKELSLDIYRSARSMNSDKTKGVLFLPFTDLSSADETYGGGRYLVLDKPAGDEIILDFNMAYNPYCVYNPDHGCPIPPAKNSLDVKVLVGEMMYE